MQPGRARRPQPADSGCRSAGRGYLIDDTANRWNGDYLVSGGYGGTLKPRSSPISVPKTLEQMYAPANPASLIDPTGHWYTTESGGANTRPSGPTTGPSGRRASTTTGSPARRRCIASRPTRRHAALDPALLSTVAQTRWCLRLRRVRVPRISDARQVRRSSRRNANQ
jgi:hypothetical protein